MNNLLLYGWAGVLLLTSLGLVFGSFLNVVIYRLPVMLNREWSRHAREQLDTGEATGVTTADETPFNLLVPRSQCPACRHQIRAVENIPVLSWLILRGRCSNCGTAIPVRYPVVECVTACAFLMVVAVFGWSWEAVAAATYSSFLIALAGTDFDTHLLPDELTLPLLWLGLIANALGAFTELHAAVFGAAGAYVFLWSVYWAFKWVTGREGMGYGDFKLFAAIGAWLGWAALPGVVLMAAVTGLGYALTAILRGRRSRHQPIPFGPFLAMAGCAALLLHEHALFAW